jgi:hypothetical protein
LTCAPACLLAPLRGGASPWPGEAVPSWFLPKGKSTTCRVMRRSVNRALMRRNGQLITASSRRLTPSGSITRVDPSVTSPHRSRTTRVGPRVAAAASSIRSLKASTRSTSPVAKSVLTCPANAKLKSDPRCSTSPAPSPAAGSSTQAADPGRCQQHCAPKGRPSPASHVRRELVERRPPVPQSRFAEPTRGARPDDHAANLVRIRPAPAEAERPPQRAGHRGAEQ